MTIPRKATRVLGTILVVIGATLAVLHALLWIAGIYIQEGFISSILIILLGLCFRLYNPDNTPAAKRKAAIVQSRERAQELEAQKRLVSLRSWCPNDAITQLNSNQYVLVSHTSQEDLAACSNYVEKRIISRERDLRSAERELERADRKANSDRMRKTASRTSMRRTGQDIRAGLSEYGANLIEKKVKAIEEDIENLHRLHALIDDRLVDIPILNSAIVNTRRIDPDRLGVCTSCGNPVKLYEYFCAGCGKELTHNI